MTTINAGMAAALAGTALTPAQQVALTPGMAAGLIPYNNGIAAVAISNATTAGGDTSPVVPTGTADAVKSESVQAGVNLVDAVIDGGTPGSSAAVVANRCRASDNPTVAQAAINLVMASADPPVTGHDGSTAAQAATWISTSAAGIQQEIDLEAMAAAEPAVTQDTIEAMSLAKEAAGIAAVASLSPVSSSTTAAGVSGDKVAAGFSMGFMARADQAYLETSFDGYLNNAITVVDGNWSLNPSSFTSPEYAGMYSVDSSTVLRCLRPAVTADGLANIISQFAANAPVRMSIGGGTAPDGSATMLNQYSFVDMVYSLCRLTQSTAPYRTYKTQLQVAVSSSLVLNGTGGVAANITNHLVWSTQTYGPSGVGQSWTWEYTSNLFNGNDLGCSCMRYRSLKQMQAMYDADGDTGDMSDCGSASYANEAALIPPALVAALWDSSKGLFRWTDGVFNQHAITGTGLAVMLGCAGTATAAAVETLNNMWLAGAFPNGMPEVILADEYSGGSWTTWEVDGTRRWWSRAAGWVAAAIKTIYPLNAYAMMDALKIKFHADGDLFYENYLAGGVGEGSSLYCESTANPLGFFQNVDGQSWPMSPPAPTTVTTYVPLTASGATATFTGDVRAAFPVGGPNNYLRYDTTSGAFESGSHTSNSSDLSGTAWDFYSDPDNPPVFAEGVTTVTVVGGAAFSAGYAYIGGMATPDP